MPQFWEIGLSFLRSHLAAKSQGVVMPMAVSPTTVTELMVSGPEKGHRKDFGSEVFREMGSEIGAWKSALELPVIKGLSQPSDYLVSPRCQNLKSLDLIF